MRGASQEVLPQKAKEVAFVEELNACHVLEGGV